MAQKQTGVVATARGVDGKRRELEEEPASFPKPIPCRGINRSVERWIGEEHLAAAEENSSTLQLGFAFLNKEKRNSCLHGARFLGLWFNLPDTKETLKNKIGFHPNPNAIINKTRCHFQYRQPKQDPIKFQIRVRLLDMRDSFTSLSVNRV